jgi:hypothetical protein
MGGHALRGAVTAWLGLIALETVVTSGSGRVSSALSGVATLVNRALSSQVPAIPDRRGGSAGASQLGYITPAQAAAGAKVAANLPAANAVIAATGGPSLNQYVYGGGLPTGFLNNPALSPH